MSILIGFFFYKNKDVSFENETTKQETYTPKVKLSTIEKWEKSLPPEVWDSGRHLLKIPIEDSICTKAYNELMTPGVPIYDKIVKQVKKYTKDRILQQEIINNIYISYLVMMIHESKGNPHALSIDAGALKLRNPATKTIAESIQVLRTVDQLHLEREQMEVKVNQKIELAITDIRKIEKDHIEKTRELYKLHGIENLAPSSIIDVSNQVSINAEPLIENNWTGIGCAQVQLYFNGKKFPNNAFERRAYEEMFEPKTNITIGLEVFLGCLEIRGVHGNGLKNAIICYNTNNVNSSKGIQYWSRISPLLQNIKTSENFKSEIKPSLKIGE
jgi:hypothetical protein